MGLQFIRLGLRKIYAESIMVPVNFHA